MDLSHSVPCPGVRLLLRVGDLGTFADAALDINKSRHISVETVALIVSANFGGMFLGALFDGGVADRIRRKRALIYSLLLGYTTAFIRIAGCQVTRGAIYALGPSATGWAVESVSPALSPRPIRG